MRQTANRLGEFLSECVLTFARAIVGYIVVVVVLALVYGLIMIVLGVGGAFFR